MARKEPIPDSILKTKVTQQLANRGLRTPCRINVDVRKGILTLTGHVQYPHQRDAAMAAVRSVDGLMRIVEQIQVRPPAKHQYKTLPPLPKKTEGEAEAAEAEKAAETPAAEAPVAAGAQAVAEDESSTTEFDLGHAKGPAAEREPASASPNGTANGEAKIEAAEAGSSELDFELGPAALSAAERTLAKTVQIAHEAHLDADSQAAAAEREPSETDFDLGPAPVKRRAAAPESPRA